MATYRIKKRSNPEQELQLRIIKYLRNIGASVGKTKTAGIANKYGQRFKDIYTFRGFPDLTVFWQRKLYFIEVKFGNNKQTPAQQTFELLCSNANIPYILAYSIDDIQRIFNPGA